jgi:hypothetical protein
MLCVLGRPRRFCDGVTGREAMTVGALPALGAGRPIPVSFGGEPVREIPA